ncbi:hypothetical protein JJQ97_06530 [Pseudomonas syringae]|uniref:hypothetical protein n=1 Tax=Pseudomonas syringae TaxID=317 RepID=UPI0019177AC0|nr:hypothetical protein [Pseudomonas syringae]QQQ51881.1 hypothetical protein JJQ97_06530 [Pseudomonas syringae]
MRFTTAFVHEARSETDEFEWLLLADISRLSKTTKGEQVGTLGNPQSASFDTDLKFEENPLKGTPSPNFNAGGAQQKESIFASAQTKDPRS